MLQLLQSVSSTEISLLRFRYPPGAPSAFHSAAKSCSCFFRIRETAHENGYCCGAVGEANYGQN
jgi:hypothetical protein